MKFKDYDLIDGLRDTIKPDWREIYKPVKQTKLELDPYIAVPFITKAEQDLSKFNIDLIGKDILEVGCCYGERSYLMARYEGTKVKGIDIDEYLVDQSPDLNVWNPEDMEFIHKKINKYRQELLKWFPGSISSKVSFQTSGIEKYETNNPHDIIISWDVLEHIIDLPLAFNQMAKSIKAGGIVFHEYNSFFSLSGGHSLCTLDFYYGHCRLSPADFKNYIQELRPTEEKQALNFYTKCLNRVTLKDIKELAQNSGFEILKLDGHNPFASPEKTVKAELGKILTEVNKIYPNATVEDLLWDSVHIILRRK